MVIVVNTFKMKIVIVAHLDKGSVISIMEMLNVILTILKQKQTLGNCTNDTFDCLQTSSTYGKILSWDSYKSISMTCSFVFATAVINTSLRQR